MATFASCCAARSRRFSMGVSVSLSARVSLPRCLRNWRWRRVMTVSAERPPRNGSPGAIVDDAPVVDLGDISGIPLYDLAQFGSEGASQ